MKDIFAFAGFVAVTIAVRPPLPKTSLPPPPPPSPFIDLARHNYAATYYSAPPEPTDSYPVSTSVVDIPVPQSSDCLDTEPCSTVLVTITSIHTISVSHVPSTLTSETATSELGSVTVPLDSASATETEESSTAAPLESTIGTATSIKTETSLEPGTPVATATQTATEVEPNTSLPSGITIISVSIIEGSSVAPPEEPFPTATDEPIGTSVVGTGSYTASPTLPEFTAAADAVRAPAVVVGLLGWAALMM